MRKGNKMCTAEPGPGLPANVPTMSRWTLEKAGYTDSQLEAERTRLGILREPGEPYLSDHSRDTTLTMSAHRARIYRLVQGATSGANPPQEEGEQGATIYEARGPEAEGNGT